MDKVKLDSAGIKEFLKSEELTEVLMYFGDKLLEEINVLDPNGEWEVEPHMRPSRSTVLVKTDSNEDKWNEILSGKIAKKIRQKTRKGKRLSDNDVE